jgi:predicted dehydrogenase
MTEDTFMSNSSSSLITPLILGHGRAGEAIAKSLACVNLISSELQLAPPVWLERGVNLATERKKFGRTILVVSNPHGLHAKAILEADAAGFDGILCEKPACVNLEEVKKLRAVKTPTAIFHGYRQMWGPQKLREMIVIGELGEIISIESRYWQSSTAERALTQETSKGWKDNTALAGEYDVYLDLSTHWVDLMSFLQGSAPSEIQAWRSFANAVSSHRDSHNQLILKFANGSRAFGSVSKTVHGATNQLQVSILGTKKSASWEFLKPDEIEIGEGKNRTIAARKDSLLGSTQAPFHGMGWLEGYIEISHRLLAQVYQSKKSSYPTLSENLTTLEAMFQARWN